MAFPRANMEAFARNTLCRYTWRPRDGCRGDNKREADERTVWSCTRSRRDAHAIRVRGYLVGTIAFPRLWPRPRHRVAALASRQWSHVRPHHAAPGARGIPRDSVRHRRHRSLAQEV